MKKLWVGVFILIGLGAVTIARGASDVGPYYWIFKRVDYKQTSTAAPTSTGALFHFFSLVELAPGGALVSPSTFTPPSTSVSSTQNYSSIVDGSLQFDSYFGSQGSLNNAFGSGNYQLNLTGGAANYAPSLSLTGNTSYSAIRPKLDNTNFNNGQLVVDATAAVTLSWNSFADHDSNGLDVVTLIITNGSTTVFRDVFPSTATSKTFAANFFKKNQSYIVDLSFVKVSHRDTSSIAGAIGLTGYANVTRIYVSTSVRTPVSGLANISTRGLVGTDDKVLISGFIITSTDTAPLTVVIRAIGPSLAGVGILDALQDPTVSLFDSQNHLIATSDNWKNNSPDATQVHAVGLDPTDDRESALYRTLQVGRYTAVVRGTNNTTGVGLVEVYNLGSTGNTRLANISTRAQVLTNEKVLIGGLIVQGPFTHSVVLRALGPSLAGMGVTGVLPNPTLQVYNAQGSTISFDNDWKDFQQTQLEATGIAPSDDKEAAILLQNLGPGAYTAIVRSKNASTGIALFEAYALN